jgi:DNA-binding beta-propeller fold protein YncE
VAVTPDGKTAFVTNTAGRSVSTIDVKTGDVLYGCGSSDSPKRCARIVSAIGDNGRSEEQAGWINLETSTSRS